MHTITSALLIYPVAAKQIWEKPLYVEVNELPEDLFFSQRMAHSRWEPGPLAHELAPVCVIPGVE